LQHLQPKLQGSLLHMQVAAPRSRFTWTMWDVAVLHLWGLVSWAPSWPSTLPASSVQRFLLSRNVSRKELLCHVRVYVSTINSQWWLNLPEFWKSWTIWWTCMEWWLQLAYPTAWDLWWCFGMVVSLFCDCAAVSKRWRRGACIWLTGVPGLCTLLLLHLSVSKGFDSSQFSNWWCSRRSCWSCGASYFQRLVTKPPELVTKTQIEGSCDTSLLVRISCYVKLPLAYN
jgi:hypothetical protein